jgi:nucleotide-binding universal stress UspA family protein
MNSGSKTIGASNMADTLSCKDARMDAPLLIGFDGSDGAVAAVRAAAPLVATRSALVVTVWEPALNDPLTWSSDLPGGTMIDPDTADVLDNVEKARAHQVASAGVALLESLGFSAEPLVVADSGNVAETLIQLSRERSAAGILIGSRGHGALKRLLLGSTGEGLLRHAGCPVIVVPPGQPA